MDKSDLKCSLTYSLPKINKIITVFYHIEIRYLTVINFIGTHLQNHIIILINRT